MTWLSSEGRKRVESDTLINRSVMLKFKANLKDSGVTLKVQFWEIQRL